MTVKELKERNVTRSKVDNGYRVDPTWRYSREGVSIKIDLDKCNHYGIKCFVASINDRVCTNFLGQTLYWDTRDAAEEDLCNMLLGGMPKQAYAMSI